MSARARVIVFSVFAVAALALLMWGARGTDRFGHYPGPYGDIVARDTLHRRHATNAVTTVVMDVRAVDTAGEELILLAAAVGVLMLLRRMRERKGTPIEGLPNRPWELSPASRVVAGLLVGPAALGGLYIVVHGGLTPGGGFQGGVILACPSLLLLLAARMRVFERFHATAPWEFAQGVGVSGFLGVGFAGMALTGAFLQNILARGVTGTVLSGGTILLLNVVVGPAVATAIVLIAVEFMTQLTRFRES